MNWEACRKLSLQELLLKLLLVPKMPQPATAKIIIRFFFVEGHCQPAGECKKIYWSFWHIVLWRFLLHWWYWWAKMKTTSENISTFLVCLMYSTPYTHPDEERFAQPCQIKVQFDCGVICLHACLLYLDVSCCPLEDIAKKQLQTAWRTKKFQALLTWAWNLTKFILAMPCISLRDWPGPRSPGHCEFG